MPRDALNARRSGREFVHRIVTLTAASTPYALLHIDSVRARNLRRRDRGDDPMTLALLALLLTLAQFSVDAAPRRRAVQHPARVTAARGDGGSGTSGRRNFHSGGRSGGSDRGVTPRAGHLTGRHRHERSRERDSAGTATPTPSTCPCIATSGRSRGANGTDAPAAALWRCSDAEQRQGRKHHRLASVE